MKKKLGILFFSIGLLCAMDGGSENESDLEGWERVSPVPLAKKATVVESDKEKSSKKKKLEVEHHKHIDIAPTEQKAGAAIVQRKVASRDLEQEVCAGCSERIKRRVSSVVKSAAVKGIVDDMKEFSQELKRGLGCDDSKDGKKSPPATASSKPFDGAEEEDWRDEYNHHGLGGWPNW